MRYRFKQNIFPRKHGCQVGAALFEKRGSTWTTCKNTPHSCLAVIYPHRTIKPTQLPPIPLSLCHRLRGHDSNFKYFQNFEVCIYIVAILYIPIFQSQLFTVVISLWEVSKGLRPWSEGWEWRWTRDLRTAARRRSAGSSRSRRSALALRRRRKNRQVEGYGTHRRTGISNRLILTLCSLYLLPRRQVWA